MKTAVLCGALYSGSTPPPTARCLDRTHQRADPPTCRRPCRGRSSLCSGTSRCGLPACWHASLKRVVCARTLAGEVRLTAPRQQPWAGYKLGSNPMDVNSVPTAPALPQAVLSIASSSCPLLWHMRNLHAIVEIPSIQTFRYVPLLPAGAGPVYRPGGGCPPCGFGSWRHTRKGLLAVSPGTAIYRTGISMSRAEPGGSSGVIDVRKGRGQPYLPAIGCNSPLQTCRTSVLQWRTHSHLATVRRRRLHLRAPHSQLPTKPTNTGPCARHVLGACATHAQLALLPTQPPNCMHSSSALLHVCMLAAA